MNTISKAAAFRCYNIETSNIQLTYVHLSACLLRNLCQCNSTFQPSKLIGHKVASKCAGKCLLLFVCNYLCWQSQINDFINKRIIICCSLLLCTVSGACITVKNLYFPSCDFACEFYLLNYVLSTYLYVPCC